MWSSKAYCYSHLKHEKQWDGSAIHFWTEEIHKLRKLSSGRRVELKGEGLGLELNAASDVSELWSWSRFSFLWALCYNKPGLGFLPPAFLPPGRKSAGLERRTHLDPTLSLWDHAPSNLDQNFLPNSVKSFLDLQGLPLPPVYPNESKWHCRYMLIGWRSVLWVALQRVDAALWTGGLNSLHVARSASCEYRWLWCYKEKMDSFIHVLAWTQ